MRSIEGTHVQERLSGYYGNNDSVREVSYAPPKVDEKAIIELKEKINSRIASNCF